MISMRKMLCVIAVSVTALMSYCSPKFGVYCVFSPYPQGVIMTQSSTIDYNSTPIGTLHILVVSGKEDKVKCTDNETEKDELYSKDKKNHRLATRDDALQAAADLLKSLGDNCALVGMDWKFVYEPDGYDWRNRPTLESIELTGEVVKVNVR